MWQQMFDRLLYRYSYNGKIISMGYLSQRSGQDNDGQEGLYELRMAFTPH
jgi:hypothetical protein